jgi:hypothetical protein
MSTYRRFGEASKFMVKQSNCVGMKMKPVPAKFGKLPSVGQNKQLKRV